MPYGLQGRCPHVEPVVAPSFVVEVPVHVVVVGCGRVGSSLAAGLTKAGHSVAVLDRRPDAFARLPKDFAGVTIAGIGFDRDRLAEAGADRAGALAAVTNGDNSNILIARVARETFGIERVVARIYDPRRAAIYQRLGIPTVATVAWATERVLRGILPNEPGVEWVDPGAKVALVERVVPAAWAGHELHELEEGATVRVAAITRLGAATIPHGGVVLQEGDVAHLTVASDGLAALDARLARGPHAGGH